MITLAACLEGVILHLLWWAGAFLRPGDARAPLRIGRALILLAVLPAFLLVQLLHTACLVLDDVLFPRYRRINVGKALFITGIPRSGTTALHRAIATDQDRYTTLTTWEALFAPSILQRHMAHGLGWLDARLGGHGRRALATLVRRTTGGLDTVHHVGLDAAEEDYLALLPAAGCFIVLLAFPAARGAQALGRFHSELAPGRRRRLLAFYERLLQRHLYADGGQRILLSKNAAFGSWVGGLATRFPQAHFIVCVREPVDALSSQISSVSSARALFGTQVDNAGFQQVFVEMFAATLQHLANTLSEWPLDRAAVIDMSDLRNAPEVTMLAALTRLNEMPGQTLKTSLGHLARGGGSRHHHSAGALSLASTTLHERLSGPYQDVCNLPHRVRPPS